MEFETGQTFRDVTVSLVDNNILEDLEMFSATLISMAPNVIVEQTSSRADISIIDDDREYFSLAYSLPTTSTKFVTCANLCSSCY